MLLQCDDLDSFMTLCQLRIRNRKNNHYCYMCSIIYQHTWYTQVVTWCPIHRTFYVSGCCLVIWASRALQTRSIVISKHPSWAWPTGCVSLRVTLGYGVPVRPTYRARVAKVCVVFYGQGRIRFVRAGFTHCIVELTAHSLRAMSVSTAPTIYTYLIFLPTILPVETITFGGNCTRLKQQEK